MDFPVCGAWPRLASPRLAKPCLAAPLPSSQARLKPNLDDDPRAADPMLRDTKLSRAEAGRLARPGRFLDGAWSSRFSRFLPPPPVAHAAPQVASRVRAFQSAKFFHANNCAHCVCCCLPTNRQGPAPQWTRRWFSEPEFAGSSPAGSTCLPEKGSKDTQEGQKTHKNASSL